jgi:transcriptional regulator with PAS, ATPase and Fis domain
MPSATNSPLIDNLHDPASLRLKAAIAALSGVATPLLLCGETGTGKDFWAGYLAELSASPTLVNLNCADVPETLLESEWFGYKQGAFTGAQRDYPGKWAAAGNGIIFLNQIDLLSLNLQAKLLRIVERRRYFPLGATQEQEVSARFVFAADADIAAKVRAGSFRADLYYRISTCLLQIEPLRERRRDIWPLLQYFARREGVAIGLDAPGRRQLERYPWPGNIRELENFVKRAALAGPSLSSDALRTLYADGRDLLHKRLAAEPSLAELERDYIAYLLGKYRTKTRVAAILGISRQALYDRLKHENG